MTEPTRAAPVQFRDATTEANLRERTDAGESLGSTARLTLRRFYDAQAREWNRIGLTTEELNLLRMATSSRMFGDKGPYYLHFGVTAAQGSGDIPISTDIGPLVQKLQALSPAQEVVVIDMLERFCRL